MSELIYDKWGNPVDTTFANADSVSQGSNALGTAGFNYGFNPMTSAWDRIRTMGNTMDGMAGTSVGLLQVMNSPMGYNGSTFDRLRSGGNNGDAVGTSSTGIQQMGAFNYGFNGTTYDRLRSGGNNADGVATSSLGIQNTNAFNLIYNGTTYDRQLSAYNMMNGMSGKGMAANTNMAYNGTTYDNVYNNNQVTLLASAARTASLNSPNQTNFNARGIIVTISVTAVSGTSPALTCVIADGNSVGMTTSSTAISATGTYKVIAYPTSISNVNSNVVGSFSMPIPRTFNIYFGISGTTPSFTFSATCDFIM